MPLLFDKKTDRVTRVKSLIQALKEGEFDNIYFFEQLIKANFLPTEKQLVEDAVTSFVEYCIENKASDRIARFIYGHMLHFKIGGLLDFDQAAAIYEQEITTGNPWAMNNRAYMHQQGQGGPVDNEKAINLYEQAITMGNASAMSNRAFMYGQDLGKEPNDAKAADLYEQAISMGNSWAMNNRAYMYHYGKGGPVDHAKAIKLYEQAITLNNPRAMFNLAGMYQQGSGGTVDTQRAARLFRQAADYNLTVSLDFLKNNSSPICRYHYAMHQHNVHAIAALFVECPDLIDEFINFDCPYLLENYPANVEFLKAITDKYESISINKDAIIQLACSMSNQLNAFTQSNGAHKSLLACKQHYIKKLNMGSLKEDNIVPMIALIIDTWYEISSCHDEDSKEVFDFTKAAAGILTRALHRVIACGIEDSCKEDLPNIALIIGKERYGKDYTLSLDECDLSIDDILQKRILYRINTLSPTVFFQLKSNHHHKLDGQEEASITQKNTLLLG